MEHRAGRENHRLRSLLAEAGWSGADLAAAVNALGPEAGRALFYDRSTVAHWLSGTRPRPPAPGLIAEALSRRLGRTVTDVQAGLRAPEAGPGARATAAGPEPAEEDVICVLERLAGALAGTKAQRRRLPAGFLYRVDALVVPRFEYADPPPPAPRTGFAPAGRVERFEVDAAEAMAVHFHGADAVFGGGYGRRALAAYLAADLAPKLRRPAGPAVRRRLVAAAGALVYQCAFMCFDDELHGPAQAYYKAALGLAAENADGKAYAVALRGLSVQARTLGQHRQAIDLAQGAARATPPASMARAFVYGQLAVAHAADGEPRQAVASLSTAERHLERAQSPAGALCGAYHRAAFLHTEAEVHALLGDRPAALHALAQSARHRPPAERRSRAIIQARLAGLHLEAGHLEQAVAGWHLFLDDYPHLRSARADTALRSLRAGIRPHTGNPAAYGLLERATTLAQTQRQGPRF